jgi:predicted nucleic acid-binding protein
MIHVDTNFLISALKTGSTQERMLEQWLKSQEAIGISAIAWAEFRCGPMSKRDELVSRKIFTSVEALSGADAETAAALFNQTGRRSRSLADCMIAAVAIRCQASLATINAKDFQHFSPHGLTLAGTS